MDVEVNDNAGRCSEEEIERLISCVRRITNEFGFLRGNISLAVVDDFTIHELNRTYLHHDYPTDVLSFVLERDGSLLEGEIVVSADTAARQAAELGWPAADELLLYVVHGALHLTGLNDQQESDRLEMRRCERRFLAAYELVPPAESDSDPTCS